MSLPHTHFRDAFRRSPFIDRIEAQSTTEDWSGWNGYKVPRVVDNLSIEYFAVRSGCAVFDLTPMEKYRVSGPDSRAFLDRLVIRDISKLVPGRVTYVAWCNDEGKVIDDGTLFQLGAGDYRLCAQHHQLDWLEISARGFDVDIRVETHEVAALAVQGPTSYSVLAAAGFGGLETLKPFGILETRCGVTPVVVSRTGYTGDLGYELWLDPADAYAVWDAIFAVRDRYDIQSMGLDALEMVRIEAGFIMPGFDFNTAETTVRDGYDRTPYEVGLGWIVSLDKGFFTGRRALLEAQKQPLARQLAKIVVDGNKPVGEAFIYQGKRGKQIGEVRIWAWSPILKANLALADIELNKGRVPEPLWTRIDYQRELKWHSAWARCHVRDQAFYIPGHRSLTPPKSF